MSAAPQRFRVVRVADGHVMAEYTDRARADEDAATREVVDPIFVREPSSYRVDPVVDESAT